ncbi:MAG TPA: phosphoribosylanthranilate isomerase [Dehalococcoidia bacterium]|nr:phosphoribosylanthranilate isomerase [Dehalococcoidia bacterium]
MKKVTKVKICGLNEEEHILAAAEAGADFVGMIFAPGKRQVTLEQASSMVKAVRNLEKPPAVVGVFVNTPASEVNRIAIECDLDLVQLSDDEDWQYCLEIDKPVIKVIHISDTDSVGSVVAMIEDGFSTLQGRDVMYLLDTKSDEAYGGTGKSFSRHIAAGVARKIPVVIAGGLNPENVAGIVDEVHPWGVDVSSGVETDGKKDIKKIREFISEVKAVAGG